MIFGCTVFTQSWWLNLLHSALTCPPGANARRLKSRHPSVLSAQQLIKLMWQEQHVCGALRGSPMEGGMIGQPYETPHFHPRHRYPPSRNDPPKKSLGPAWPPPHRCRTFRSCLYKWGMASSVACECGAEEQTVDHVVLQCLIHRLPRGLHGLTVLDDETIEWLLSTCPEI